MKKLPIKISKRPDAEVFIVDTRKPVVVRLPAWSMKYRMEVPKGASHLAFDRAIKGTSWMKDRQGRPIPEYLRLVGRTPEEAIKRSETNIRRYIAQAEAGVTQGNAKLAAVTALRGQS